MTETQDRQRLRGFLIHLGIYFMATIAILGATLRLAPGNTWGIWLLVAWGVAVALHAAWVIGLLPGGRR